MCIRDRFKKGIKLNSSNLGFKYQLYTDNIGTLVISGNTSFFYDNAFPEPDIVVSERAQGFSINSLTIELLINNAYSADISPTNPVYLELAIHD